MGFKVSGFQALEFKAFVWCFGFWILGCGLGG